MRRTRLAAAALIPLLLGLAAPMAFGETAEPEPPRNRLSPTDDSELKPRATPPLAPPQPLVPRRINELPKEPDAPRTATPTPAPAPEATPKPAIKSAMKHHATPKRTLARKTATAPMRTTAPKRAVTAVRPPRQDDSLGALFAPGRTPQRVSPEAPPSTLTYNYLAPPSARRAAPAPADAGVCPSRPGTSLSALFACTR